MEILQITGLGIVAVLLIIILKVQRPDIALQVSIVTGVVIFLMIAAKLSAVLSLLGRYTDKVSLDGGLMGILLKIVGIAYIAEFGAEICRDAGEGAIASKLELAGKVIIVVMAVPIITSLLDVLIKIMP